MVAKIAMRPARAALGFCAPLAALLLVSCTTTPGGGFCIGKPHRFSDATVNVMTDAEVAQELTHNKQGAALCGWKP